MSQVHVIIDSTANVPQKLLQEWPNLHVVPLTVLLNNRQINENELSTADLFTLIQETGEHPKTSQPAPGEFVTLFSGVKEKGDSAIVITLSGSLSGTVQSARMAVQMVESKNIFVIDSGTTAIGMVQMAEQALEMAAEGQEASVIAAHIEKVAAATHTLIVPGTLEYLHKGGRIGGAASLIGTILQIRPILYLENGRLTVLDKVRTRTKAISRMTDELKRFSGFTYISVVSIEAREEALVLQQQIQQLYPHIPVLIGEGGSVLASHLGPGLVGLIFQEKQ
ncbi:MAG TPA: DegV family protein [Sporomusaceae bacterium]|nr:DegV family protein [Sporomusaceae bacterium]